MSDPAQSIRAASCADDYDPNSMPVAKAREFIARFLKPVSAVERLHIRSALGRVLAADVISPLNVPSNDNSAMDGYALRFADLKTDGDTRLKIAGTAFAGVPFQGTAKQGECVRIMTGAVMPKGLDTIVMQEHAKADGDHVTVGSGHKQGQHLRFAGEDLKTGQVALKRGLQVRPAEVGLIASLGINEVSVYRRLRVAFFSTGDELVMPGAVAPKDMKPGAIYNSNRFFLRSLLQRLGCEVTDMGVVPDRLDATVAALREAAEAHDLILTSGGVSVGEEDHVKPAVRSLGTIDLWQLAIKPGKPFAHGRIGRAHFVGLPGNPVSSFVTFLLLVRPMLLKLQGMTRHELPRDTLRADFDWPRADKRREFLRVRRNAYGGLDLFPNQSSGVLTSMVWGDGLVDNPPGQTIAAGQPVAFIDFSRLIA